MNLDVALNKGNPDKPAIIFIHGLGMDKDISVNPLKSRILGGRLPLNIFLREKPPARDFGLSRNKPKEDIPELSIGLQPKCLETLFNDLKLSKYSVVSMEPEKTLRPHGFGCFRIGRNYKACSGIDKSRHYSRRP